MADDGVSLVDAPPASMESTPSGWTKTSFLAAVLNDIHLCPSAWLIWGGDGGEIRRLGCTISRWYDEVLAYFKRDGLPNGKTEATDGLIKRIKRTFGGHGFHNLRNYRLRLLFFRGSVDWQDEAPPPSEAAHTA